MHTHVFPVSYHVMLHAAFGLCQQGHQYGQSLNVGPEIWSLNKFLFFIKLLSPRYFIIVMENRLIHLVFT
jgi:hypothetical protein